MRSAPMAKANIQKTNWKTMRIRLSIAHAPMRMPMPATRRPYGSEALSWPGGFGGARNLEESVGSMLPPG